MAKFSTRRIIDATLRVVGRAAEDYAQELQEWAEKIQNQVNGGIPAGFNAITPTIIQAGIPASAGSEADGWMSAGATLAVETGPPIGLSNENTVGSGTAIMRADAHIRRDVRIYVNGVELATRNALNLVGLTVFDDVGNDRVQISAGPSGGGGSTSDNYADYQLRQMVDSYALRRILQSTFR